MGGTVAAVVIRFTAALGLDPHTSGIDLRDLGIGTLDAQLDAR